MHSSFISYSLLSDDIFNDNPEHIAISSFYTRMYRNNNVTCLLFALIKLQRNKMEK